MPPGIALFSTKLWKMVGEVNHRGGWITLRDREPVKETLWKLNSDVRTNSHNTVYVDPNGHLPSIHSLLLEMDPHDTALTIHELLEGRDLTSPVVFEPLSNAFVLVAKQLAESADFRYGSDRPYVRLG